MSEPVFYPDGDSTYCTSCGFSLADGWNHCPKCGTQKGNSEKSIQIKDTVLMGDLNISKKEDISAAVKASHECTSCGSMGALQKACKHCKKLLYCEVCESDFNDEMRKDFSNSPKYSSDFTYDDHDLQRFELIKRSCFECLDETIIPNKSRKCWCCGLHCLGRVSIELVENNSKNKYEYFTCQNCFVTWNEAGGRMLVMQQEWSWHSYVLFHNLPDDYAGYNQRSPSPLWRQCCWPKSKVSDFWTHYHKFRLIWEPKEVFLPIPVEITERIIQCVDLDIHWKLEELKHEYSGNTLVPYDDPSYKIWKKERKEILRKKENEWWFIFRNENYGDFCEEFSPAIEWDA